MENTKTATVQTVGKAVQILDLLGTHRKLSVTEIGKMTGVNNSSVSRILSTLTRYGLTQKEEESGKYQLGYKILDLSNSMLASLELKTCAQPVMEQLKQESGETINLMVLDRQKAEGIYIGVEESMRTLRMVPFIGKREALHCSALGKTLMAYMPLEYVDEVVQHHGLPKYTENTISSLAELRQHLQLVRKLGYAMDNGEGEMGIRCVAAPIFSYSGRVVAAISIAGPYFRLTDDKITIFSEQVVEAAWKISYLLGCNQETRKRIRAQNTDTE